MNPAFGENIFRDELFCLMAKLAFLQISPRSPRRAYRARER